MQERFERKMEAENERQVEAKVRFQEFIREARRSAPTNVLLSERTG
ncbi:MAG: hypothetical protein IPK80_35015 [Nannocystis sp.]|nr:hypothetical protein [Nannocystis sp.]